MGERATLCLNFNIGKDLAEPGDSAWFASLVHTAAQGELSLPEPLKNATEPALLNGTTIVYRLSLIEGL